MHRIVQSLERRAIDLGSLVLVCLAVYATAISSRWKIDFHHDGYIFFQIHALSQGKLPYEDFLIYRGILYPFFVNLLMFEEVIYISQVKLLNVVIIVINSILIKLIIDKTQFRKISVTLAALWLATSPAWTSISGSSPESFPGASLIDPNHLSLLLLLASTYLFINSSRNSKFDALGFFSSGAFMGLSPWVQQKGLLFPLFFVCLSIVTRFWRKTERKIFVVWLASLSLTMLLPILWISQNQLMELWFEQSFIDPIQLASLGSTVTTMSLENIVTRSAVFLLLTLIFIFYTVLIHFVTKVSNFRLKCFMLFGICSLTATLPFFSLFQDLDTSKNLYYKNWFIIVAGSIPNLFWYSTYSGVIFFVLMLVVKKVVKTKSNKTNNHRSIESDGNLHIVVFAVSLGLASVFFLFPNFGYFWWFAPTSLISCILMSKHVEIEKISYIKSIPILITKVTIIPFVISGLLLFFYANFQPKLAFSEPKLKHMIEFSQDRLEDQELQIRFIEELSLSEVRLQSCLDVFFLTALPNDVVIDRYYGPVPVRDVSSEKFDFQSKNIITCAKDDLLPIYTDFGYEIVKKVQLNDQRQMILWEKTE